ncbi:hypothetical protein BaRGS_00019468 [Batillaria attramentaria]|uniref:C1q domain-containing protein n=1 Tax=Batillaria attramentaria TaxID=370345 RepID=A0ABD0KQ13_9CAEN
MIELVAFSSETRPPQHYGDGDHVILTRVSINTDGVYDPSTGVFTVPYDGEYSINYSCHFPDIVVMVDSHIYNETDHSSFVHLRVNQKVWLRSVGENVVGPGDCFIGVSLQKKDE